MMVRTPVENGYLNPAHCSQAFSYSHLLCKVSFENPPVVTASEFPCPPTSAWRGIPNFVALIMLLVFVDEPAPCVDKSPLGKHSLNVEP